MGGPYRSPGIGVPYSADRLDCMRLAPLTDDIVVVFRAADSGDDEDDGGVRDNDDPAEPNV